MPFPISNHLRVEIPGPVAGPKPPVGQLLARVQGELGALGAIRFKRTAEGLSFEVPWEWRSNLNPLAGVNSGRLAVADLGDRLVLDGELRFMPNAAVTFVAAAMLGLLLGISETALAAIVVTLTLWLLGFGLMYAHAAVGVARLLQRSLASMIPSGSHRPEPAAAAPHN